MNSKQLLDRSSVPLTTVRIPSDAYVDLNWVPVVTPESSWMIIVTFRAELTLSEAGGRILSCESADGEGFSIRRGDGYGDYKFIWPSADGETDLEIDLEGVHPGWTTLAVIVNGAASKAWAFAVDTPSTPSQRLYGTCEGFSNLTDFDNLRVRIGARSDDDTEDLCSLTGLSSCGLWTLDQDGGDGVEGGANDAFVAWLRETLGGQAMAVHHGRSQYLRDLIQTYPRQLFGVAASPVDLDQDFDTTGVEVSLQVPFYYLDQQDNTVCYPITGTFAKVGYYAYDEENDLHNGKPVYRNRWAAPNRLWWDDVEERWVISASDTPGDTTVDMWVQQTPAESLEGAVFIPADAEEGLGQVLSPTVEPGCVWTRLVQRTSEAYPTFPVQMYDYITGRFQVIGSCDIEGRVDHRAPWVTLDSLTTGVSAPMNLLPHVRAVATSEDTSVWIVEK